jgi:hypothetical protein
LEAEEDMMNEQITMRFCLSVSAAMFLAGCGAGGDAFPGSAGSGPTGTEKTASSTEQPGSATEQAASATEKPASGTETAASDGESSSGGGTVGGGSCASLCQRAASSACAAELEGNDLGECVEECEGGVREFASIGCDGSYFAVVNCVFGVIEQDCNADVFEDPMQLAQLCPNEALAFFNCVESAGGFDDFDDDFDDEPDPPSNDPPSTNDDESLRGGCEVLCQAADSADCNDFDSPDACVTACIADVDTTSSDISDCLGGG